MNLYCGVHASAPEITKTTKSLKICYILNINHIHFAIVHRRTEIMHQRVSHSGSSIIKRDVGKSRQRPRLAFVLKEDILITCCNKNDVM